MTTDASSTAAEPSDNPAPSWTKLFTRISIAIALVALGATIWSVGPSTIWSQLGAIGFGFAAVIGMEIVITGFDSAALSGFLGPGGRRPSFLHVVRAQVAGRAINAVTPLASLGEATKATTLMEQTSSKRAIAAVFHYNLASIGVRLITIVIGAPICALVLDLPHLLTVALLAGSAIAAVALVGGILLVRRGMLASLVDAVRSVRIIGADRAERWRKKLDEIDKWKPRRSDGFRKRWLPAMWVIGSRLLSLVSMWIVLRSVGYTAGPGTVAAIATAGTLISMIASVVPMGLGISEGSNAALFAALGAPASLGVTMVLGSRITLLVYATIGLFLLSASSVVVVGAKKVQGKRKSGAGATGAARAGGSAIPAESAAGR